MPSRKNKLSKRRLATLRKNKKLKNRLTKMRGGSGYNVRGTPHGRYYNATRGNLDRSQLVNFVVPPSRASTYRAQGTPQSRELSRYSTSSRSEGASRASSRASFRPSFTQATPAFKQRCYTYGPQGNPQTTASSRPSFTQTAPAYEQECFTRGDSHLIPIGTPILKYLSKQPYNERDNMYSDHAPIFYNLNTPTPTPIQGYQPNPNVNIITWNVGMFGNYMHPTDGWYNHKFTMKRLEQLYEYRTRLRNLVHAMAQMINNPRTKELSGNNEPFLFCQELPILHGDQAEPKALREMFMKILNNNGLGVLCDSTGKSEFGMIYIKDSRNSTKFTLLDKHDYQYLTYMNKKYVFPAEGYHNLAKLQQTPTLDWRKFEIYFYVLMQQTYYYVNVHVSGESANPAVIVNLFNKIVDVIQLYRRSRGIGSRGLEINNVTIYIIGDYNFNIASPAINELITTRYGGDPLNLFANQYLGRKITKMYKFTTEGAIGCSLVDNNGTISQCNIDCMLQLDLVQG